MLVMPSIPDFDIVEEHFVPAPHPTNNCDTNGAQSDEPELFPIHWAVPQQLTGSDTSSPNYLDNLWVRELFPRYFNLNNRDFPPLPDVQPTGAITDSAQPTVSSFARTSDCVV